MRKQKTIFLWAFIFVAVSSLAIAEEPASAPPQETATSMPGGSAYKGMYKQGSAPFSEKTAVSIQRAGDGYAFMGGGQTWNLEFKSIRGAISTPGGVWVYWFDGANTTMNALFKMDQSAADAFATEFNDAVKAYWMNAQNAGNAMDEEQYKQNYEQYKQKAIEQAK